MFLATAAIGGLNTRIVYADSILNLAANQTSYAPTLGFGTAHPRRRVFAGVTVICASGVQPSMVTIGGVTAVKALGFAQAGTFSTTLQIWSALVPTGASGVVSVSGLASGDMDGGAIYTWAAYDVVSATPRDTATATGSTSPNAIDVDVPAGGFVIALGLTSDNHTSTWGITGGLTLDAVDTLPFPGGFGASLSKAAGATPLAITANYVNSGDTFYPPSIAASFK